MASVLHGRPAAGGMSVGTPVVLEGGVSESQEPVMPVAEAISATAERFERLASKAAETGRTEEAEILEAYATLVADPMLAESIGARVADGTHPAAAVTAAAEEVAAQLEALTDTYLAQRAEDVRGVAKELVATLLGVEQRLDALPERAIVCAADLTPADTVRLDLDRVRGFATEGGGPTSHTAIVARSLGLPAVVGVEGLLTGVAGAASVLLDGDRGEITIDPDEATRRAAERRMAAAGARAERHRQRRGSAVTFAGRRILIAANVGTLDDLEAAREVQADGIGLFRSEFLFLGRDAPPGTDEQRAAYEQAAEAFSDPVVVRTLDIGGDKEIAYLELPREDNPFLGVRGLRLCLAHPDLFATQLDALIAASVHDNLRVMFPMVATVADLRAGLDALAERARVAGAEPPPAGVMIETPAAALLARHLCAHAAFLSIGTNDLTQYTMAADRTVGALGAYQDPLQPPVLRLIAATTEAAAATSTPVAVCGEAAGDPAAAALLLGLGVEELSCAPARIDEIRWLTAELDPQACQQAAHKALEAPDADAARELAMTVQPA